MSSRKWTRREFGQASVALAGASLAVRHGFAASTVQRGFAFVASAPPRQPDGGSIHSFHTEGDRWTAIDILPAAAPAHLLMHPTLPVLYAVHAVDTWGHLPRGAVSAYRVDRRMGRLDHLHSQPLSLGATHPRRAVFTANATHLFVAAEGGGIFNLLPLAADGVPQPPSIVRKEPGKEWSDKRSTPHTVALHPDGSLFAADEGHEVVTRFRVEDGVLTAAHGLRVHHGMGPAQFALAPDGRTVYTLGANSRLSVHALYPRCFSLAVEHHQLPAGTRRLAIAPDGNLLVASGAGFTLQLPINAETGKLGQAVVSHTGAPNGLFAGPQEHLLVGINAATGQVAGIPLVTGIRGGEQPFLLARVPDCTAAVFLNPAGVVA